MAPQTQRQTIATFAIAMIIASLVLILVYINPRCSNSLKGQDCLEQASSYCSVSAAFSVDYNPNPGNLFTNGSLTCPWRLQTSVIGSISLVAALIFYGIFAISKSLKPEFVQLGTICTLGLLVTLVLMIIDINDGRYMAPASGGPLMQIPFIINVVLVGFTFVVVAVGTSQSLKSDYEGSGINYARYAKDIHVINILISA